MHRKQDYPEKDELRARFTAWLDITAYRARLKYLRKEIPSVDVISIEDLPDGCLVTTEAELFRGSGKASFDFEEERLSDAFQQLPIKRQEILTMLFVEGKKPEEIARCLNCSVQHVYDQRYQALKKLRLFWTKVVTTGEAGGLSIPAAGSGLRRP